MRALLAFRARLAKTKISAASNPASAHQRLSLSRGFAIALRELRGASTGFAVFLGSIVLGVAAITAVGSVARSLADGLAVEGRNILGGDLSVELVHREAKPDEYDFLGQQGRVLKVALLRAMARRADGEAALVEIKAVDRAYPLAGAVGLEPDLPLAEALAEKDGVFGIVADETLGAKLAVAPGAVLSIGEARFELRAILAKEPDRLAAGVGFGARVLISGEGLRASRLLGPGSLVRWLYRIAVPPEEAADAQLEKVVDHARTSFPEAGWEIRTRKTVSPQLSRNLDRFTQFLTLIGLTALVGGGVGVADAVRGYVVRKRPTVAVLKALGATGSTVFALMLTHVMLVAALGIAAGALLGAGLPFLAAWGLGPSLPFPLAPAVYPDAVAEGVLYGFLTALGFSLWPLGHAHDVPVQALFREQIEPSRTRPRIRYVVFATATALALAGAVLALSSDRWLTLRYAGSTLAALALLRGLAFLVMWGAARLPHIRYVALRLAIGNLHRPGALTPSIVVSLGLGLTLVVALTMIDRNLRFDLEQGVPGETPSFFFVDVQNAEADSFTRFLETHAPDGRIELVPMLRGRIVELNGLRTDVARPKESVAWVLQGDRGLTFAADLPRGASLVRGAWWPADYAGPPLVSIESEIAEGLGLEIGDEVKVNVLGREIAARIANTRKVNWRTLGINFVLVFSPDTFSGAPYADLATLTFPNGGETARELGLLRETARAFPAVTSIRVKDALEALDKALGQLSLAIRVASSVTLLASILVLGGALSAGQQARLHDAVVLKTLGATRPGLLAAFACEFGLIGLVTSAVAVGVGGAAAFVIVRYVMGFQFVWLWGPAFAVVGSALAVTILLGLLATWRILGRKPARYLREL